MLFRDAKLFGWCWLGTTILASIAAGQESIPARQDNSALNAPISAVAAATEPSSLASLTVTDNVTWSTLQVTQWAQSRSPTARLYDAEAAALNASFDRDDRAACAQANLLTQTLSHLACYQRHQSTIEALKTFTQIQGLEQQRDLLLRSLEVLDELISLVEQAERLELQDGNPLVLQQERLNVEDQLAQVEAGIAKSRILLAQQTGQSLLIAESVSLSGHTPGLIYANRDDAFAAALAQRCDLMAIRLVCQSLNAQTLPAVRQVMATLQPGLGLAISQLPRKALLASLHTSVPTSAELCQRREECQELQATRVQQVQAELFAAWIDVESNQQRLRIAQRRAEIGNRLYRQSKEAIELDKGKPGSDLEALLQQYQAEGQQVQQQLSLTQSLLELYRVVGALPANNADL